MKLKAVEFIRRFLLHVLPTGFQKIRYYGILGNNVKKKTILICRKLFNVEENVSTKFLLELMKKDAKTILLHLKNIDLNKCSHCEKGRLLLREVVYPKKKYFLDSS